MTDCVSRPNLFDPESLRNLSPLPGVALEVMRLLASEEVQTTALTRTISSDPVFVADLLCCANSALFSLGSPVKTVRHAIVVLGRDRLKSVVLTTALRAYLKDRLGSRPAAEWWRHSLATALLSEAVAVADSRDYPSAYTAGLLHDIGRLGLLITVHGKWYREFLRAAEKSDAPVTACEREFFGTDHCGIGEILLKQWRLPNEFCVAARHHHEPDRWITDHRLRVVGSACAVSGLLGFEAVKRPQAPASDELLMALPQTLQCQLRDNPGAIQSALAEKINSIGRVQQSMR